MRFELSRVHGSRSRNRAYLVRSDGSIEFGRYVRFQCAGTLLTPGTTCVATPMRFQALMVKI